MVFFKMGFSDMRPLESVKPIPENISFQKGYDSSQSQGNSTFISVVPGLWDDLQCEHVAVPFAAWALANWALASEGNRLHIQELDQDGHAIMAALTAPERTVKWHGSLVARLLLEDRNLPLIDSVTDGAQVSSQLHFKRVKLKTFL
ncbi:hypothetical protein GIB67_014531 [Kingdonia uniflora]|uniref:Uncharacterized protein n=1 Tax=Kingdonia uniflora TaxID=39325 RepID=A0A7J7NQ31_9MAGN|nr:hypothetical protein GIB67_014531 [Kingdonia uniflora]